jgi:hypothetical protein
MEHIADHFASGRTLENSRPDFRVLEDMRNKGCISDEDFKHCFRYTERPYVDGLRPYDWLPEEIIEKNRATEEKANRVVVNMSREEARERRRKKSAVFGTKKP